MTFDERLRNLVNTDKFTFEKARYAKNKVALRFLNNTGWKSYDNRLFNRMGKSSYSGREKAYIISVARAEKFIRLLEDELRATS